MVFSFLLSFYSPSCIVSMLVSYSSVLTVHTVIWSSPCSSFTPQWSRISDTADRNIVPQTDPNQVHYKTQNKPSQRLGIWGSEEGVLLQDDCNLWTWIRLHCPLLYTITQRPFGQSVSTLSFTVNFLHIFAVLQPGNGMNLCYTCCVIF